MTHFLIIVDEKKEKERKRIFGGLAPIFSSDKFIFYY
jgi:hypothetical protein